MELGSVAPDLHSCPHCSLLWFAQGQLKKLDLFDDAFTSFSVQENEVEAPEHPRCAMCEIPLHQHKYPTAPQVLMHECYRCGGASLSASQVREIRENSMNEAQMAAYLDQLAHSVPGYTLADDVRVSRGGVSGFAKKWQKYRFWSKRNKK